MVLSVELPRIRSVFSSRIDFLTKIFVLFHFVSEFKGKCDYDFMYLFTVLGYNEMMKITS